MGMAMEIFAVRPTTLERLRADPPLVWLLIAPDEPEMYEEARAQASSAGGLLGRLFGRKPAKRAAADEPTLVLAEDEGPVADLDKAWHGLHFLFTGTADGGDSPMNFLTVGGDDIGDVDVGFGPARAISPPEVIAIARQLRGLSDEELRSRFDGPAMNALKIYPEIWDRGGSGVDPSGYLFENLAGVRKAVTEAATRGHGLVIVLH
ncbi:MAG: YfbM family protein [Gemmatimonadaceae bacterium]